MADVQFLKRLQIDNEWETTDDREWNWKERQRDAPKFKKNPLCFLKLSKELRKIILEKHFFHLVISHKHKTEIHLEQTRFPLRD